MTNEFAAGILKQYREKPTLINEIQTVEEAVWLDEALDMAISLLKQAPCDTYTEGYFKGYDDGLERKLEEDDAIHDDAYLGYCPDCGSECMSGSKDTECWKCGFKFTIPHTVKEKKAST